MHDAIGNLLHVVVGGESGEPTLGFSAFDSNGSVKSGSTDREIARMAVFDLTRWCTPKTNPLRL